MVYNGKRIWGKIKEKMLLLSAYFLLPKIILLLLTRGHGYIFFQHHGHAWWIITLFFFVTMPFPPLFFSKGFFFLGAESTWKHGEFILVVIWKWNGIFLSSQCRRLACAYMWVYDVDQRAWEVSTQVTRVWQSSMEWQETKMYMV